MSTDCHKVSLLSNDLYQFTCSYSYFVANKHYQEATFEVFFRKYPFGGYYVICAGIQSVLNFIRSWFFTYEYYAYLRKVLPYLSDDYYKWICQSFKGRINFRTMKEGEIVFSKEPIITVTGPLGIVQLLETPILNLIGFASLVATNASRMAKAVEPKQCIYFGLRRAQGPDGGLSASQYAFLGGFTGTSNMQASMIFNIPVYGTMSHAYVTAFSSLDDAEHYTIGGVDIKAVSLEIRAELKVKTHEGELAAFIMYARAFPNNFKALIDTYNTLESGLLNTVIVGKVLHRAGVKDIGIRLDSGDLCSYSKKCRYIWNKLVPYTPLIILASDDLHEERLLEMYKNNSYIDVYAIGTHIATCKKQPALGLVCKLVSLNKIPKMKFSEDEDKATYPGNKTIYRVWTEANAAAKFDLISLEGEYLSHSLIVVDPSNHLKKYKVYIVKKEILNKYWNSEDHYPSLLYSKQYVNEAKLRLPASIFDLKHPTVYKIFMTTGYARLHRETMYANTVIGNI